MKAGPPFVDRTTERASIAAAVERTAAGKGSLVLLRGPAGIGKTRLLDETVDAGTRAGLEVSRGSALQDSFVLYHPWIEALRPLGLHQLFGAEPPPRLLALYLISPAGLPAGRVEREGFSEDPLTVGTMLNVVAEFVRDALAPRGTMVDGEFLRASGGKHGFCALHSRNFGLVAAIEGRETEIFLEDLRRLAASLEPTVGATVAHWDGNRDVMSGAERDMQAFLESGKYDGVDIAVDGTARKFDVYENILFGLRRRATRQHIMVVLDDLQWADAASIGLLHFLARNLKDAGVLICGAYRVAEASQVGTIVESLARLARDESPIDIDLRPLSTPDARDLAESILGNNELGEEFFQTLEALTQGNPLFVREVLSELMEGRTIGRSEPGAPVTLLNPLQAKAVPRRVHDVVASRLARLDRSERELLDAAAVCGTRFTGFLVARMRGLAEGDTLRGLTGIERTQGLIRASGDGWAFDHPVVREVVYGDLSAELRSHYHREAAAVLEQGGGPPEEVGTHLAAARDPRAVAPLRKAAADARKRGAPQEASRLLLEALPLAPMNGRGAIMEEIGDAYNEAGDFGEADVWFLKAIAQTGSADHRVVLSAKRGRSLERLGDLEHAMRVMEAHAPGTANTPLAEGHWRSARAWLRHRKLDNVGAESDARWALSAFERETGGEAYLADCWNTLGIVRYWEGRIQGAAECFERGLATARGENAAFDSAKLRTNLVNCLLALGRLREAATLSRASFLEAQKRGNRLAAAISQMRLAAAEFFVGRLSEATAAAADAVSRLDALGSVARAGEALSIRAMCALELGRKEEAETMARAALARTEAVVAYRLPALVDLAEILVSVGKVKEGLGLAEEAADECRTKGGTVMLRHALLVRARGLAALGEAATAEEGYRQALYDLDASRESFEYAQGMRWYAESLVTSGQLSDATTVLGQAIACFERLGADLELRKCDELSQAEGMKSTITSDRP